MENVRCHSTIQLWAEDYGTNASALRKKQLNSFRTVRSPQNIGVVRQLFIRSFKCSVRIHCLSWKMFAQEYKFPSIQNGGNSRDSAVGVATGYGFVHPGVEFRARVG
jgi:hypothetical protein